MMDDSEDPPYVFSRVEFPDADFIEKTYMLAHVFRGRIDTRTAIYMDESDARDVLAKMQWVLDGPKE